MVGFAALSSLTKALERADRPERAAVPVACSRRSLLGWLQPLALTVVMAALAVLFAIVADQHSRLPASALAAHASRRAANSGGSAKRELPPRP